MKYYKTLKTYKASNVSFNIETKTAFSYGWWAFVKLINGVLVFNDYRYSPSTQKHQAKLKSLLRELNLTYVTIKCPKGLQSDMYKESAIEHYNYEIKRLQDAMNKKGSKKEKNKERALEIQRINEKIQLVQSL